MFILAVRFGSVYVVGFFFKLKLLSIFHTTKTKVYSNVHDAKGLKRVLTYFST